MARLGTGAALLLLATSAVASFITSNAREVIDYQVTGHHRQLKQSPQYGQSIGGAAKDNGVGWSVPNSQGYNAVNNVECAAGLTQCHYTPACVNLTSSVQYCGSCDLSCDFYTQVCQSGTCACKDGFSTCATRGGRCLDAQSCPAGSGSGSNAVDVNTQDVGGTVGVLG